MSTDSSTLKLSEDTKPINSNFSNINNMSEYNSEDTRPNNSNFSNVNNISALNSEGSSKGTAFSFTSQ